MKVLVLDNYDSFAYNLVQYLGELGAEVETVRNDRASVEELLAAGYDRCVVSPGPCTPEVAGIRPECRPSACVSATRRSRRRSAARCG
jgi:anthranilate/para-aminobenzoate synthase component II